MRAKTHCKKQSFSTRYDNCVICYKNVIIIVFYKYYDFVTNDARVVFCRKSEK